MKKIILLYLILGLSIFGFSQDCTFSGVIKNAQGDPIPYSSIYIPKLATGKMCNMEGKFKITLPCASYKIKIQSLGYETLFLTVDLSSNYTKTIVLPSKSFSIKEFTINASDEDPAYNVMRKAIVMAKYYKKQVSAYDAKIYVRVFFVADKIPKMVKMFADDDIIEEMKTGDLTETLIQYHFEKPNTVREKIISAKSASGDTSKGSSPFMNFSFYDLGGNDIVSPLSKSAFSVYKFELMNSYVEAENTVFKIKIIPKRKGNDLMNGYIYINDGSWNINSVDVKFKQQFVDVQYKQIYSEISENAWMPTSQNIKVRAKAMGFKGHFKYIVSMSNIKLKTDSKIDAKIATLVKQPIPVSYKEEAAAEITTIKKSITENKIQNLMDKEKLTRGETMKLVRLVNKQNREEKKKIPKDSATYEVTKGDYKTEYADNAFVQSDSAWNESREVPLSKEENVVYTSRDSMGRIKNKEIVKKDTVTNKKRGRSFAGKVLFFDEPIKSKNKNSELRIPGLLKRLWPDFNTVDGFTLRKYLFSYKRKYNQSKWWKVEPYLKYAFARKDLMGQLDFTSQYNIEKRSKIYFSAGKINSDFNNNPMPNFFNSISTLFFTENYKKLYQKEFATLGHSFDIVNGLNLNTSIEYADRTQLFNNSNFKVIKIKDKNYSSNSPPLSNNNFNVLDNHKALNVSATLGYTPNQYYKYQGDEKRMLNSKSPTFELTYKHGIKNAIESQSDFSFIEAAMHHTKSIGLIDKVVYHVGGGKFLSNNKLYFADYKSFNTQPFYIIGNSKTSSFKLLDFYSYNAQDYFFEAHLSIQDNFLLLKNLPILNTSFLSEALYANYLYTEQKEHYYEFGYGLKNIFLLFDLEAYASFINDSYNSWGVKLSINFINNHDFD